MTRARVAAALAGLALLVVPFLDRTPDGGRGAADASTRGSQAAPVNGDPQGKTAELIDALPPLAGTKGKADAGGVASSGKKPGIDDATVRGGDYPLAVDVAPSCIARGTGGVATIKTGPSAQLSLMVAYEDETQGQWTFAKADPATGRFVWSFSVEPDAPLGRGMVLVAATAWEEGYGGAAARRVFRVAAPGAC